MQITADNYFLKIKQNSGMPFILNNAKHVGSEEAAVQLLM